jgi:hypothetical protein
MWRPGAALAALLLALVATSFFDGDKQSRISKQTSSTLGAKPILGRRCGRAVIRDLVDNGRLDHSYARRCYVSALRLIPEEGAAGQNLADTVSTALKEQDHAY